LVLEKNNIKTTKIGVVEDKYFVLRITHKKAIKNFMGIIKPSNEYHIKRYLNIKNDLNP